MKVDRTFSPAFSVFCVAMAGFLWWHDRSLVSAGIAIGFGGALGVCVFVGIVQLVDTIGDWWTGSKE